MIKEIPMRVVKEVLICDVCGSEREWNGVTLTSYPPQFAHYCKTCGTVEITSGNSYPNIDFREVNEQKEGSHERQP